MSARLLSSLGLKYNPFSPDVPVEALWRSPRVEHFCWRVERMVREGGFALLTGEPGLGKSVTLRILAQRLSTERELTVGLVAHPCSNVTDFYRELGDLFGVSLSARNRWGGFKALREKWHAHLESTLLRPVLLIDEAQEMEPSVLSELRLLSSEHFDSRALLTVVLSGDQRLPELFRSESLIPLGSRMRVRLTHEYATLQELHACVTHRLMEAGHPTLCSAELLTTLCEHAAGNYRVLLTLGAELLDAALARELPALDVALYLEVFAQPAPRKVAAVARATRR